MSVKLKALAADSDDANISVCGPRLTPIVDVWGHDWHGLYPLINLPTKTQIFWFQNNTTQSNCSFSEIWDKTGI